MSPQPTPSPLDRDRLGKVLGMLGSAHDGEVLAAARQAHRIVSEAGATWEAVFAGAVPMVHAAETVTLQSGEIILPPHGRRWIDTAMAIRLRSEDGAQSARLSWIGAMCVRLTQRPPTPTEALALVHLYRRTEPVPAPWTPR